MPEVGDFSRHLDFQLQQSSTNHGWSPRCFCAAGVKSEVYQRCAACFDVNQDSKPASADQKSLLQVPDIAGNHVAEIPLAPAPAPAAAKAPKVATPSVSSPVRRVTRTRSSTSDEREPPRRQRGRPPNGSRAVPARFKGVRQRKGVPGFLVEIRPPKWKRTIWLGTYQSEREAAGAYDAGIFYTNKKTPFNFPVLKGSFPALPSQLRLANTSHSDEIKTFVQREAHEAARRVARLPETPEQTHIHVAEDSPPPVSSASSSSEESVSGQDMPNPLTNEDLDLEHISSPTCILENLPPWSFFDDEDPEQFSYFPRGWMF